MANNIIDVKKTKIIRYQFDLFGREFSFSAGHRPKTSIREILKMALIDAGFSHVIINNRKDKHTFLFVDGKLHRIMEHTVPSNEYTVKVVAKLLAYPMISDLQAVTSLIIVLRRAELLKARMTCKNKKCPNPFKLKPPCVQCKV